MKGKDLIKWIQDNKAEDLDVLIDLNIAGPELYTHIMPKIIDHSNSDMAIKYNTTTNYGYVGIDESLGYTSEPEENEIIIKKFISL